MKQMRSPRRTKLQLCQFLAVSLVVLALMGATVLGMAGRNQAFGRRQNVAVYPQVTNHAETLQDHDINPVSAGQASNNPHTAAELVYLLEEEKLAHDVYQAMADTWGARVFSNIKNSEATHQNLVWSVMQNRGLADSRQAGPGVFTNLELQKFYNELVAQGNQSTAEAYKAGVKIEERDIADLKQTLSELDAKDTDVKDVLETLLRGSQNHLRAFGRQASR